MNKLTIVTAQVNLKVGDIEGNTDLVIAKTLEAKTKFDADLVAFPELTLTGYPPEDLLFRPYLYKRVNAALEKLRNTVKDVAIAIGYPENYKGKIYNIGAVIKNGKVIASHAKHHLPNYTVFDEKRYFSPGKDSCVFEFKGVNIGLVVCEDLWAEGPLALAKENGAELILSLNASPFALDKSHARRDLLSKSSKQFHIPIVYVNLIGGQDELIFDGGSLVYDQTGKLKQQSAYFEEELMPVEITKEDTVKLASNQPTPPEPLDEQKIYNALVLGVRDYINKNNFPGAVLGLSGGVDSALTLAIAIDALGPERVEAVMMPTRFTSKASLDDAKQLSKNYGCRYTTVPIEPIFESFLHSLAPEFKDYQADSTEENLQARCRGTILMAISNKKGPIVLTTGNKSELAVGYTTLYGDMAGGFSVLKDVYKTMVYRLCRYRNTLSNLIPERIIERAPSAELREDQKDEDSLPAYDILDEILHRFVTLDQDPFTISNAGFNLDTVKSVVRMVSRNEYKRRQAPIGIRITEKAFGKDRRYPITSGYFKKYDEF